MFRSAGDQILVVDTENTTWNTGNAFDQRNFNVCISFHDGTRAGVVYENRGEFEELWNRATLIIGFNLKYDLHWLRRLGYIFEGKRFWCTQSAEFTLGRMQSSYPSLDECAERYNLGAKLGDAREYWDQGYNTHQIPRDKLTAYAKQDVELTYKLYLKQQELIQPHQRTLLSLLMQDMLVLEEIEWNGLRFDKAASLQKAKELETQILDLQSNLKLYHNVPDFNWGSGDHLSALLYGGTITEERRIPVGLYKSGKKEGQVRYTITRIEHRLPRMYTPIKGSELKKEGKWSVEEDYLRKLKGKNKNLIEGILKIKELQKLNSTYFRGLPALHEDMHFEEGIIHGQFHQCVARTGRLSSTKPNLQNLSEEAQTIFTSRYDS